jgi:hypothetical protein
MGGFIHPRLPISTLEGNTMNARFKTPLLLTLTLAPLGISLALAGDQTSQIAEQSASKVNGGPLVSKVRGQTARFRDINVAIAEHWVQGTPCVSGPNAGAMGVHFLLPSRIHDGALVAEETEALIYEPLANGAMRLVGVEYIVIKQEWEANPANPAGSVPVVDGHLTNLVTEPNRYGLPAFYELHVWAWENNPNGSFADWNTQVTCNRQPDA